MNCAMIMKILMSIVVVATMLVELAVAVDHTVGAPNGGWDTSTDLESWVSSQTFTVGDNIVFSYTPNHDVLEVSMDDYDSCSTSNATSTDTTSPTTIALSAAGNRYFICGTAGHCDQGMKVEITTQSAASPDAPSPSASTTPGTPVPARPSPSPSSSETVKVTAVSMVGLGFLVMMFIR